MPIGWPRRGRRGLPGPGTVGPRVTGSESETFFPDLDFKPTILAVKIYCRNSNFAIINYYSVSKRVVLTTSGTPGPEIFKEAKIIRILI